MLWAVGQNYVERTRLLLEHSVSPQSKYPGRPGFASRPANVLALLLGNIEIAEMLRKSGSETPLLTPSEALLARCMVEDEYDPLSLPGHDTPVVKQAIAEFPDAVVRATSLHRPRALERLAGLGFDVNYLDRITPLHQAAMDGALDLVKTLIWLGADPGIRDAEFQTEPAAWARYFGANEVAGFLESSPNGTAGDGTYQLETQRTER
jgi:ankyrin repeat protein